MDHPIAADSASRFEAYVEGLVSVIGHGGRARPLRDCYVGHSGGYKNPERAIHVKAPNIGVRGLFERCGAISASTSSWPSWPFWASFFLQPSWPSLATAFAALATRLATDLLAFLATVISFTV